MSSITCPTCSAVLPELADHGVTRCTACQSLLLVANGKIVRSARATDTQLPAMEAPTRVGRTKREPAPARPPAPLSPTHQQEAARAVRLSNPAIPVLPSVPSVSPPARPPAVTAMRGSLPASNTKRSEPQSVVVPLKSLEPEQPEATVREPVPELKPLFASDKSGPVATKPSPVAAAPATPATQGKAGPRMTQPLGAIAAEAPRTPKPTVVKPVASSELVKAVMEDEHTWVDEPIPAGLSTAPPPKPAPVEKSFAEALAEHDESPVVGVRPMPKPPGAPKKSVTAAQKTVVAAPAPSLPITAPPPASAATAAQKTVVAAPAPSLPVAAPSPSSPATAAQKTVVAAPAPLLVDSPPESRPALNATSLPTTPSPFKAGESTGTPTPEPDQLDMTAPVRNPRRMAIYAGGGLAAAALLVGVLVVRHRAPAPIASTTNTPTTTAPTETPPTEVAAAPAPTEAKPSPPVAAAPAPHKSTTTVSTTSTKPPATATPRPAAATSAPTRAVAAPVAPTTTAPAPTRVAAADPAPPVDRPVRVAPKRNHRKVVLEYDKAPAPAATAPDSEVDEAQVATARSAYQRGNQLLFAGNAKGAVDSYKESLRVYPGYVAGYRGLGLAYSALGDNVEARSAFGTYIRTVPNAKDVPLLKKRLEKLR